MGTCRSATISSGHQRAFHRRRPRAARPESSLSNLIADAQLESTAENGAQIAFMNAGGVRADLLFASSTQGEGDGVVTYREAFNVQPFSNILQTFDMTGAEIDAVLEQQWVTGRPGGRDILRLGISDGFTYEWSAAAPFGSKIDPASIKLDGVTLDPNASYRVTVEQLPGRRWRLLHRVPQRHAARRRKGRPGRSGRLLRAHTLACPRRRWPEAWRCHR